MKYLWWFVLDWCCEGAAAQLRVEDVGWRNKGTMVTIGGKVWPAMVVAILIGISMSLSVDGLVAQTSTTTPPATHAKKPVPKTGTTSADAGKTAGTKAKGSSAKAKSGASGKATKKKGAAAGKK